MKASAMDGRRSWWPQQWALAWLNLALIAPIIYLYVGLPLVMREQGWTGTQIGLLQLAGLPAILKFLMATPIDRYRLGRANYRNWAMVLVLCYAASLLALAAHDLASTPRWLLFLLAVLVNLLGTWADVPVNALAIQILPESERLRAGALRSAATSVGAIVGGGIMLLIQTRMGWAWPFWLLVLGLFAGVLLVALLRSSPSAPATDSMPVRAGWREWRGYFAVPQHRLWAVLLLLYVSFIGAAWVYLKPLLLDHGFAPQQIALIVGVGGGLVAAVSSLAASRLTRMLGTRVALPLFSLASVGAVGALAVTIGVQGPPGAYIAAAMAVALAMGAAAGLVFGLMMYHTRSGLAALDYGIQSSLFIIARTLVPLAAGVLLDRYGYGGMLAGLLAGLTLALAASLYSRDRIHIKASTAH